MDNEVLCTFESSFKASILSLGDVPLLPVLSSSEGSGISKTETKDYGLLTTLSLSSKKLEIIENEIVVVKNCKCALL
jgi:hypothetical protein